MRHLPEFYKTWTELFLDMIEKRPENLNQDTFTVSVLKNPPIGIMQKPTPENYVIETSYMTKMVALEFNKLLKESKLTYNEAIKKLVQ